MSSPSRPLEIGEEAVLPLPDSRSSLRGAEWLGLIPAFACLALMIVWAAHDGGYDADTWYWGALVILALLAAPFPHAPLSSAMKLAVAAFGLYVAWSYLSIAWASSPGDALTGSNRALLYLLVFALFARCAWTPRGALAILLAYALALCAIGALLLIEMATGSRTASLFSEGRLLSPTGYFNSTAALFTFGAFLATALGSRRELPALLRGVLLASGSACLQLALLGESRGWLFTLPVILVIAIVVCRDRLRVAAAAVLPALGALVSLHPLLDVFRAVERQGATAHSIKVAIEHAGKVSLLACAVVLVAGTALAALGGRFSRARDLPAPARRLIGTVVAVLALAAAVGGGVAATHGHPLSFAKRQWHGFIHPASSATSSSTSHFATVGSGRYDFWRVSIDAVAAHPFGGLGQDNFADYYLRHRHTTQEPSWTHSIEMRLLAHTGIVGTLLFLAFLIAAVLATVRNRRARSLGGAMAAIALLPLVVWLVHGSVDWFWEMPALSGPALGLLAMAGALTATEAPIGARREQPGFLAGARRRLPLVEGRPGTPHLPRPVTMFAGAAAVVAAVVALGFPYLAVRGISSASDVRATNPAAALADLRRAAKLNPLSAEPGRVAGTIALLTGQFNQAESSFRQAIAREPDGWFAWLGLGLAASSLGDGAQARHAFQRAASINSAQPAVTEALKRVDSPRPLTAPQALRLLVLAH